MKPRLPAALIAIFAATPVFAGVDFPIIDTTCAGAAPVADLTYGTFLLQSEHTRVYTVRALYPFQSSVTLTPPNQSTVVFTLATCDAPPGPQARCRATSVQPGSTLSLQLTDNPNASPSNDYWILVNSSASCSSFRIDAHGPVG
jgi:hypothetical protein